MSESGESEPPAPQGRQVSVNSHPLWRASRRTNRGDTTTNAACGQNTEPPTGPRLSSISIKDLELQHRVYGDGAESTLWSEDEGDEQPPHQRKRAKHCTGKSQTEGSAHSRQKGRMESSSTYAVSAAVFGGAPISDVSEDESSIAEGGDADERRLASHKRALPIRGVECLGCSADRAHVTKIDQWISNNMSRMEPCALFKTASLVWKQQIVDVAALEDVDIPEWKWKDLRLHYLFHAIMPEMQRMEGIRQLAAMRKTLELSMMREEDNTRVLDPKNADMMMKIIAQQSKELQLLQASTMPPPPPPSRK